MDQQLLGQPYYNHSNSNSMMIDGQPSQPPPNYTQQQIFQFNADQPYVIAPNNNNNFNAEIQPQQAINQPYPSIDFFYETPHVQPTSTDLSKNYTNNTSTTTNSTTANTSNYQIPIVSIHHLKRSYL